MEQYTVLIRQIANSFYKKHKAVFNLEWDEVLAESQLSLLEAVNCFNPEKGRKMESWIAYYTFRKLRRVYSKKEIFEELDEELSPLNISCESTPEDSFLFKETLNGLSIAAQEVTNMIFGGKLKKTKVNETKREIKHKLRSKGYSWSKIQFAFSELKRLSNTI